MQFLSLAFLAFTVVFWAAYWAIADRRWQNSLLLLASWGFAWSFSPWAVVVLVGSAAFEWVVAGRIARSDSSARNRWMWVSVVANIAMLVFFRYHGFFQDILQARLAWLGMDAGFLKIAAPVGVSFWVLQKMSLSLDVHSGRLEKVPSFWDAQLLSAFFPIIVSGPIERARHLIPQFAHRRTFRTRTLGTVSWVFAIGALKKVVIADNLGREVEAILGPGSSGMAVVVGFWIYAVQIWADFSGYSDMAWAVARLFGIDVTENFRAPYGSTNISDFWKRWHISFSSWLNEMVFVPLSFVLRGSGNVGLVVAAWATFLASGLWHGNGWNYVAWGSVHATAISAFLLSKDWRKKWKKKHGEKAWATILAAFVTFNVVCLGYVFFRSASLTAALETLRSLAAGPLWPSSITVAWPVVVACALGATFLHHSPRLPGGVSWVFRLPVGWRATVYICVALLLLRFYAPAETFIYFQF